MHIILLCQPHFSEAGETEYRILEDTAPSSLTNQRCTRAFPSPSNGSSGRQLPCRSACDTPAESKSRPPSHTSGATERVPGTGVISCGLAYHRDPNSASAETAGPRDRRGSSSIASTRGCSAHECTEPPAGWGHRPTEVWRLRPFTSLAAGIGPLYASVGLTTPSLAAMGVNSSRATCELVVRLPHPSRAHQRAKGRFLNAYNPGAAVMGLFRNLSSTHHDSPVGPHSKLFKHLSPPMTSAMSWPRLDCVGQASG